ncbi:MAG: hypothetical protein JRN24_03155 [Nitrososphaerota archaeon]|nr:hypothetical protein [Nitrososphaerota archaeon]
MIAQPQSERRLTCEAVEPPESRLKTARRLLRLKAQVHALQKGATSLKADLLQDLEATGQDRLKLAEGTIERSVRVALVAHRHAADTPSSTPMLEWSTNRPGTESIHGMSTVSGQ